MSKTQSKLGVTVNGLTPFAELNRATSYTITDVSTEIDYTSQISNILTASIANNDITVPTSGYYEVTFSCHHFKGAAEREIYLTILKNGVTAVSFQINKVTNQLLQINWNKVLLLAANDVISTEVYYDSGSGSGTDVVVTGATLLIKKLT